MTKILKFPHCANCTGITYQVHEIGKTSKTVERKIITTKKTWKNLPVLHLLTLYCLDNCLEYCFKNDI